MCGVLKEGSPAMLPQEWVLTGYLGDGRQPPAGRSKLNKTEVPEAGPEAAHLRACWAPELFPLSRPCAGAGPRGSETSWQHNPVPYGQHMVLLWPELPFPLRSPEALFTQKQGGPGAPQE